jgi:hypothetical protein
VIIDARKQAFSVEALVPTWLAPQR